ncbi:hypothetical protein NDU88_004635 [Pleurodeles waltl]|uniref:Uncharacterized protein n=1 Tax=Pleurodeles waltl TaxID=8319 RepID=A0AAV7MVH2_PLEWA|nr:hypothetical protein NDU88_004635 [Pleurodeles waltl]
MNLLTATDNPEQGTTVDSLLQEITAVGLRLEGIDSTISTLAAANKSKCLDIAGFQSKVSDLEQRVVAVYDHLNTVTDGELRFHCIKLVDLENRGRGDNGFPEHIEGANIQAFLKETLPTISGISFDPSLEFQRAHRLGPKRAEDSCCPRPIIACLLHHTQAQQLITTACPRNHSKLMAVRYILWRTSPKRQMNVARHFYHPTLTYANWK